jgi:hypothetical protein
MRSTRISKINIYEDIVLYHDVHLGKLVNPKV